MTNKFPHISVIIAAHNEEKFLPQCLTSLQKQDFSLPYEIIVVNNASNDKTAAIARSFGARVVDEPILGLARACRTGFAQARAPIIARTDADTIVPKQWLSRIYHNFASKPNLVGITGPTFPLESRWYENLFYYPSLVFWMFVEKILGTGFFYANMALRSKAYKKTGGFDPTLKFGEDAYICKQLSKVGPVKIDLHCYIYASTRRLRAMGLLSWVAKYSIANYLRTWFLKKDPIAMHTIRSVPAYRGIPNRPLIYLYTLPVSLILSISLIGFLQTDRGEEVAREVLADTKGAVSKQQASLKQGVAFIKNVRHNSLRYYQSWNRKEST